jgi:hypothetical protein
MTRPRYPERWVLLLSLVLCAGLDVRAAGASAAPAKCALTQGNAYDGGYKPNAPVRPRVGTGFVLTGTVRSGIDCKGVQGAHVEFWFAGPSGYDDAHRGTVIADPAGIYRFESSVLSNGSFRPHIHIRVAVPGFKTLTTVYLPHPGTAAGMFDLVLEPEL